MPDISPRFQRPVYPYRRSADQLAATPARRPVVVVGAGPVGLSMAIDLRQSGVPVVLLDEDDTVSEGSRAIAHAQRTLEIWQRLGCAAPMTAKGVAWQTGKVFWGESLIYQFGVPARETGGMPPFINLQQYHVEAYLVDRCMELGVELRWKNRVTAVVTHDDHCVVTADTPDGPYRMECDWLLAADGANSPIRRSLGLKFDGQVFDERFLICDLRMRSDFPPERWFWFDPPFNRGHSALLHMQADNIWRVGLQLGVRNEDDFDVEAEKRPERVVPRLKAMLGADTQFDIDWISIFKFKCRRLPDFQFRRVIFLGDAAHQLSPFGGRGANSGVQDVDNLGWKLKLVLDGQAPEALLRSYHEERSFAADENILVSTRATDFITPKSKTSRMFRDAVLSLAGKNTFARALINSGRPSTATRYPDSSLSTPDTDSFAAGPPPGAPCFDGTVVEGGKPVQLLTRIDGGFVGLCFGPPDDAMDGALRALSPPVRLVNVARAGAARGLADPGGALHEQYGAAAGAFYLLRPDQHVAARWRSFDLPRVEAALRRACAKEA